MKKISILLVGIMMLTLSVSAQRYAIIDTKYILDKMPEYKDADTKLQQVSEQWQKDIDDRQAALDKSEGITVIFADPKLDKSDDVLHELGVK